MVTADAAPARSRALTLVPHPIMAAVAMVILGALHARVGRIPVADGEGWDKDWGAEIYANRHERTAVVTT